MVESTILLYAWMGVILIQAVVHYFILGARRRGDDEVDVSLLNEKKKEQVVSISVADDDPMPRMTPHVAGDDEDEEESLDGDEPRVFFELLKQTGSEMMRVSERTSGASEQFKLATSFLPICLSPYIPLLELYFSGESCTGADYQGRQCGCCGCISCWTLVNKGIDASVGKARNHNTRPWTFYQHDRYFMYITSHHSYEENEHIPYASHLQPLSRDATKKSFVARQLSKPVLLSLEAAVMYVYYFSQARRRFLILMFHLFAYVHD
jgi:hypothetical protein